MGSPPVTRTFQKPSSAKARASRSSSSRVSGSEPAPDAVVAAVEHGRHQPATLGGKPVEVKYVLRINLKLPR